jgi:hypothetical protein
MYQGRHQGEHQWKYWRMWTHLWCLHSTAVVPLRPGGDRQAQSTSTTALASTTSLPSSLLVSRHHPKDHLHLHAPMHNESSQLLHNAAAPASSLRLWNLHQSRHVRMGLSLWKLNLVNYISKPLIDMQISSFQPNSEYYLQNKNSPPSRLVLLKIKMHDT